MKSYNKLISKKGKKTPLFDWLLLFVEFNLE